MAEQLKYAGEFVAVDGTVWRAEITAEAEEPFAEVGALTFEAEEPVIIDWPETPKEQSICGSSVTLRIESPGDRTYTSLYTVEPGAIRLRLLRGGALYWSGTLDPEFYEEPYERAALYAVSLTFSDFGILERKPFALSGMASLSALLSHCLVSAGVEYSAIDASMISSFLTSGEPLTLDGLKVRADNFYDEEGEAMTLREVLEGAFQPLGLRMVQRAGKIYVYDLNGLYNAAQAVPAVWSGDSSTLGVDAVYNNAKITWSPYAKSGELSPEECWEAENDDSLTNLNIAVPKTDGDSQYLTYHLDTDLQDWPDTTDSGFTLWTSAKGKNAEINTAAFPEARFFKIVPQYDGEESEGVAIFWNGFRGYRSPISGEGILLQKYAYGVPLYKIKGSLSAAGPVIFSGSKVWLPPVTEVASRSLRVRVSLNLLFDPRFNPFASASDLTKDEAEKDWQAKLKARYNFLYVPVTVKFRPDGSQKVWCWTNRLMVGLSPDKCLRHMGSTLGQWVEYNAEDDSNPTVWGYLSWYDPRDRKENSGIANGWRENRPAINPHFERITTWLSECPDGQYLTWPPEDPKGCGNIHGGELWVEVRSGWILSDGGVELPSGKILDPHEVWTKGPKINWILARLPKIEIVRSDCFDDEIPDDDIEYSAELHPSAKEPLEIETVCGTSAEGVPTARGAYYIADTDRQLTSLTRAGRTATAEELLIGTLYSQYATRHTKLSGEIELPACGLAPFTEANQPGKRFILTAETQNAIMATSEAVLVELSPDEYDKDDNGEEV